MKKILFVFGTRPEAIKMAPVIKMLQGDSGVTIKLCLTAQHREMLDQVMRLFDLHADYDLNVMTPNQSLPKLTSALLEGMDAVLQQERPGMVLVHGDTTTTFVASLAAFYRKIPVGHIEAGLRTGSLLAPWPEEANRRLTTVLTELHFAPTENARRNLLKENVDPGKIHVTGNTVIDALFMIRDKLDTDESLSCKIHDEIGILRDNKRIILVTGHRRESFGEAFHRILTALRELAEHYPDVHIVFPVHMNPAVRGPVREILGQTENISLIEPLDYLSFVYLMHRSYLVITDSGGIQEEAPSLGKPVLVTREVTERPEAVEAGTVRLVGSDTRLIVNTAKMLLDNSEVYAAMSYAHNPYGDGQASARIRNVLMGLPLNMVQH